MPNKIYYFITLKYTAKLIKEINMIVKLKSKVELEEIIDENENVLVYFHSNSHAGCKLLEFEVKKLNEELSDETFVEVNIDKMSSFKEKYEFEDIPTLILFKNKEIVKKHIGFMTKSEIENMMKEDKQEVEKEVEQETE
jgi:thioredoxin 1